MRILLFDEAYKGHNAMWMEEIGRALSELSSEIEIVYAFPHSLKIQGRHVKWIEPRSHGAYRRMQRLTGVPFLAAAKWRCVRTIIDLVKPDRLLLMQADEFLHPTFQPTAQIPWVPIYFHPRFLRDARAVPPLAGLRSSSCPYIYILDSGVRDSLSDISSKPVAVMPDFSNTECGPLTPRCQSVLKSCASRPIIGALGPVTRHKNIGTLLRLASLRPDWHFLIAGLPFWQSLAIEERRLLRKASAMENVTIFLEYLSHTELNSLTAICQVLYAAYTDFRHSSNKLVRACAFRIPIVVADKYYMAEIVEKYAIGALCNANDVQSVGNAVELALKLGNETEDVSWDRFLALNSLSRLRYVLGPLVANDMEAAALKLLPVVDGG